MRNRKPRPQSAGPGRAARQTSPDAPLAVPRPGEQKRTALGLCPARATQSSRVALLCEGALPARAFRAIAQVACRPFPLIAHTRDLSRPRPDVKACGAVLSLRACPPQHPALASLTHGLNRLASSQGDELRGTAATLEPDKRPPKGKPYDGLRI
ncbi:protein of unknown function (plasmid) [Paraburkholderia dioscoreae]|uniref:Uncharacterized protein n=1 Tax=Paraburkholderia dioscoreae TaxID=2604047 RepID=A0A5Q4YWR1_9BURK|nr:protein of unknown function [Paraburkholderia dioscoreae]